MMVNSYFIAGNNKQILTFQSLDCCERMYNSLTYPYLYELISLEEIDDLKLRNKEKIDKYIRAISQFLDVELYFEDISEDLKKTIITKKELYADQEKYLTYRFKIENVSNKREIAVHNLVRYLWYPQHDHMVNIILSLFENPKYEFLEIQDIFAIAHSFQISNNRALTGMNQDSKKGLLYFPDKSIYINALNRNENFNGIFSGNRFESIINFSLKGSFFEDSVPFYLNSKDSLRIILEENLCYDNVNIDKIIHRYFKLKTIYNNVIGWNTVKEEQLYFTITGNDYDDNLIIDVSFKNMITGRSENKTFTNIKELYEFITKKYKIEEVKDIDFEI